MSKGTSQYAKSLYEISFLTRHSLLYFNHFKKRPAACTSDYFPPGGIQIYTLPFNVCRTAIVSTISALLKRLLMSTALLLALLYWISKSLNFAVFTKVLNAAARERG